MKLAMVNKSPKTNITDLMPCLDGDSQEEQTEGKRMTKFSDLKYTGFLQSLEFLKKS